MNSTAQLPGVNRPLSVELRLIKFCSCGLDSQGKHDTSFSRGVFTKRSDFPRAKGAVRCSPFGGVEFGKTSRLGSLASQAFTEWCKEQDIELRFIQPGKPDQNAYIERFNRTYREEVPSAYLFDSLEEVREITAEWLERYNEITPHDALGSLPPARYRERLLAAETPV